MRLNSRLNASASINNSGLYSQKLSKLLYRLCSRLGNVPVGSPLFLFFWILLQAQWLIESGAAAQSRLTIEDPSEGRFEEAALVTSPNRDSITASKSWIPCTTDMVSLSGSTETTLVAALEDSPGLHDFELVNDLDPALEKDQRSVRPLF